MGTSVLTVTGGAGNAPMVLRYDAAGLALINAQALAAAIDAAFTTATYDRPNSPVGGSTSGGLLLAKGGAISAGPIDAQGFDAVVLQNNKMVATVSGGGDANGQVVLAGRGGLDFEAVSGNVTVDSGGGNSAIVFGSGNDVFYSTDGNNTVTAIGGNDTIYAGTGANVINLAGGNATVGSTGTDSLYLGAGDATVDVSGSGSDVVTGASSVAGPGYTLIFIGGTQASTVLGGAGSYSIMGGAGGGNFTGGSGGGNFIQGGSGNVTIQGGGAGDTLAGGTGTNLIQAGLGNETLSGGLGQTEFSFTEGVSGGNGALEVIADFNASNDYLHLGGGFTADYALAHITVSGGSTFFTLEDGTKVELLGFTGLNGGNFH
jgi:Ca2+-binding RTX toxin-like protein